MPTSARKSSLGGGARNRTQKAHIPYRGDNPEVGKKTGIAVQHVERKSDGFEPFAELLQQADGRTPPRPRIRKKSVPNAERHQEDYYDDDYGEMSMQLDSPVHHLVNMRPPATPQTTGRRSSIRPVARTSEVDFDKIPSPRPSSLSTHRTTKNAAPGPSSLSRSIRAQDIDPDSDSPNEEAGDYYDDNTQNMDDGLDDYTQDNTPTQASVASRSFGQLDAEDDEEEEEEQTPEPEPTKSTKKKPLPRERQPSQSEEEIEAEIAQGLEDVGLGHGTEDEEQDEEETPPPKKKKVTPEKKPARKTATREKKENRPFREGVRRSQREHYAPLEYWRGEKLVYGRSATNVPILVPQIKEIVRIPKAQPEPLGAKRKRGASMRARSRSRAVGAEEDQIPPALPVPNPEEGWDDDTDPVCTVIHFTSQEEVMRRISWTAKRIDPRISLDETWSFDKIFGDDEFLAAGQLAIPPGGRKPSKYTKDNTYVFYLIEGAVNFKIHNTSMVLATGAMFIVPRGNTYLIENISNRTAKIFFTQARKMDMTAEDLAAKKQAYARRLLARSSSAGAPLSRSTAPLSRSKSLIVSGTTPR